MAAFHAAMLPTYFVTVLWLTAYLCLAAMILQYQKSLMTLRDDFFSDDGLLLAFV